MALRMTPIALAISMPALPQLALAQSTTDAGSEVTLSAVKVTSSTDGPTDLPKVYAGGQVAKGARLGLLGNQDLMDIPFNITSYTANPSGRAGTELPHS